MARAAAFSFKRNDKYRALLETLKAVTGKEVDTEEKEKK